MILHACVMIKTEHCPPSCLCRMHCPHPLCLGCCGKGIPLALPTPPSQQLHLLYKGVAMSSDVQRRCSVTIMEKASLQVQLWQGRLSRSRPAFSLSVHLTFHKWTNLIGLEDCDRFDELLSGHIPDECHAEASISLS